MEGNRWDHRHKWWHSVLVILLKAAWAAVLVLLGSGLLAAAYYFWFFTPSPFNLIGGMPLSMIGLALVLLGPLDFLEALLNAKARRGTCLLCQPVPLRDFFVPNSINNHFKGNKESESS